MNEERKEKILKKVKDNIKEVLAFRHKIKDFIRRHKETVAVGVLLFSQVAQNVSAQTSVKDKKIEPISEVAQHKANGNYDDYRGYLENCERLTREDMTKLVNKGIKDGHLIPQLDTHFAVYTVNPDNPGPFTDTKDFYALKNRETGELLCVSQKDKESVTISNFNKDGVQFEGKISGVKSVVDWYDNNGSYRQVEMAGKSGEAEKAGKVYTQFYEQNESGLRTPVLTQTWSQDASTITVRNPDDASLRNPGGTTIYHLYADHIRDGSEKITGIDSYEVHDKQGKLVMTVKNELGSFKKATVYDNGLPYDVEADHFNQVITWKTTGKEDGVYMTFDELEKAMKNNMYKGDPIQFACAQNPESAQQMKEQVTKPTKAMQHMQSGGIVK